MTPARLPRPLHRERDRLRLPVMPTRVLLTLAILLLAPCTPAHADIPPSTQRTQDVIYGRLNGTALTLDVLTPPAGAASKHLGLLLIVSGRRFRLPRSSR